MIHEIIMLYGGKTMTSIFVSFTHLSCKFLPPSSPKVLQPQNLRKYLKSTLDLVENITTSELGVKWSSRLLIKLKFSTLGEWSWVVNRSIYIINAITLAKVNYE